MPKAPMNRANTMQTVSRRSPPPPGRGCTLGRRRPGRTIRCFRYIAYGFAAFLFTGVAAPGFAAEAPTEPSAFVSELARSALLSVTSETVSATDRQQRLGAFLDKDFDMPQIARFVLGRYWQKATETERQDFAAAYRNLMIRVYSRRFVRYSGESFRVVGQHPESATSTVVYTEMSQPASGPPLKVEWHVGNSDGYRITDITVAGISMALAQREDFRAFLQKNGGDLPALIQQLQVKTAALESQ